MIELPAIRLLEVSCPDDQVLLQDAILTLFFAVVTLSLSSESRSRSDTQNLLGPDSGKEWAGSKYGW